MIGILARQQTSSHNVFCFLLLETADQKRTVCDLNSSSQFTTYTSKAQHTIKFYSPPSIHKSSKVFKVGVIVLFWQHLSYKWISIKNLPRSPMWEPCNNRQKIFRYYCLNKARAKSQMIDDT